MITTINQNKILKERRKKINYFQIHKIVFQQKSKNKLKIN